MTRINQNSISAQPMVIGKNKGSNPKKSKNWLLDRIYIQPLTKENSNRKLGGRVKINPTLLKKDFISNTSVIFSRSCKV